eukprot:226443-Prorocentrum_lima.AAC.1
MASRSSTTHQSRSPHHLLQAPPTLAELGLITCRSTLDMTPVCCWEELAATALRDHCCPAALL